MFCLNILYPPLFSFQLAVSETAIPTIHRLEQVSSEEKVGSLAENLMEALKEHPDAKAKVHLTVC